MVRENAISILRGLFKNFLLNYLVWTFQMFIFAIKLARLKLYFRNAKPIKMITLHHLEYSQSFRILWLLEELNVEYDLKLYERDKKTHLAPIGYKALSPLGTAPVITDGELVLAESNAIVDYILDKHPDHVLRPTANDEYRAQYLFWLHASQGSLMPLLLISVVLRLIPERAPFFLKPILRPILNMALDSFAKPRIDTLLEKAEIDLGKTPWFGGDKLSAADIVMSYPLESMKVNNYLGERYPNCLAWLERVNAYPSFKRAKEKDGKPTMVFSL